MKSKAKKTRSDGLLWRTCVQLYGNHAYRHLDYLTAYETDDETVKMRFPVGPSNTRKLDPLQINQECRVRLIVANDRDDSLPSIKNADLILVITGSLLSKEIRLHPDDGGLWTHELVIASPEIIDTQEERPLTRPRNPARSVDRGRLPA